MIEEGIRAELSSSFRVLHGKLYGALLKQFGVTYVDEIEDVIQNTFLKALRTWKPGKTPENKEGWLFIVAKNEMLNYLKALENKRKLAAPKEAVEEEAELRDMRLETILFLCEQDELSEKAKILMVLKNVFGLHTKEISGATLMTEEAIHKLVNRSKKKLMEVQNRPFEEEKAITGSATRVVGEILYAVFSIGFDSFDKKTNQFINEDLCLEALSLAKLLVQRRDSDITSNLIALFCLHLSRMPAKIEDGVLIPFLKQNRGKWDQQLLNLGLHYLRKPAELNAFYLEALITSLHMAASKLDVAHWQQIVKLYKLWVLISDSPLIKLNLAYSLYLAGEWQESNEMMQSLEGILPKDHFYFTLVKAEMIKEERHEDYQKILKQVIDGIDHDLRRDFLISKLRDD